MGDQQANSLLETLQKQNFYERLGVEPNSTRAQLRQTYGALVAKWHPDRHLHQPPDVLAVFQNIVSLYNEAYATLSHPAKKKQYDENLRTGEGGKSQINAAALVDLDNSFRMALQMLERGQLQKSHQLFQKVVNINPEFLQGQMYHAYTDGMLHLQDKNKLAKSIRTLESLQDDIKAKDELCYMIGYLYFSQGEDKESRSWFTKALSINDRHIKSQRQLRLLDTRKGKVTSSSSSFVSKLKSFFSRD